MNADVKAHWTAALRSGRYPQAVGALRRENEEAGFCCLGVLCELAVTAGVIPPPRIWLDGTYAYADSCHLLPFAVVKWAGLGSDDPSIQGAPASLAGDWLSLAEANDNGVPFSGIADIIEAAL